MGGLVVKQVRNCFGIFDLKAIISAHNDQSYNKILANVKGIVFIGTPHRGAGLAKYLSNILSVCFAKKKFVDKIAPSKKLIIGFGIARCP